MHRLLLLFLTLSLLTACNRTEQQLQGTWQPRDEKHTVAFRPDGTFSLIAGPNALTDGFNIQGIIGLFSDDNYEVEVSGTWRVEDTDIVGTIQTIDLPDLLADLQKKFDLENKTYRVELLHLDDERLEVRYPERWGRTTVTYFKLREPAS